jgi:hypothetical protein
LHDHRRVVQVGVEALRPYLEEIGLQRRDELGLL